MTEKQVKHKHNSYLNAYLIGLTFLHKQQQISSQSLNFEVKLASKMLTWIINNLIVIIYLVWDYLCLKTQKILTNKAEAIFYYVMGTIADQIS